MLDDDRRTDRAERLLGYVTVWLAIVAAAVVGAVLVMPELPWPASTGVGVSGIAVAAGSAVQRRRRLATEADRAGAASSGTER